MGNVLTLVVPERSEASEPTTPTLTPTSVDRLRDLAFVHVCEALDSHGTVLSTAHQRGLWVLCDTMARQALGHLDRKRRVCAAGCGVGKTLSLAAFIRACEELDAVDKHGHRVSIAVSASQITHLVNLHETLTGWGVPKRSIGIKHTDSRARVASTEDSDRRFMLVTHARIRKPGSKDESLYTEWRGHPRSLMVHDESLFPFDVSSFSIRTLGRAVDQLTGPMHRDELSGNLLDAACYLDECLQAIREALNTADPQKSGIDLDLPERNHKVLDEYRGAVSEYGLLGNATDLINDFLRVSQENLRVLDTRDTGGVIHINEVISKKLDSILVLDASYPCRSLSNLDKSLSLVEGVDWPAMKDWSDVSFRVVTTSGARSRIEKVIEDAPKWSQNRAASAFAQEVVKEVRAVYDKVSSILIFTYKSRDNAPNMVRVITDSLEAAGLPPVIKGKDGEPDKVKINVTTWGNETSTCEFSDAEVCIMAGVLHRSTLDIAASIKGARHNIKSPTSYKLVDEVQISERAHCILQAAGRTRARITVNGKALPAQIVVFDRKGAELEKLLSAVMPGSKWETSEPEFMPRAATTVETAANAMLARLTEYLAKVPAGIDKVSSQAVKKGLKLDPKDEAAKSAFADAGKLLDRTSGWVREERGFHRFTYRDAGFDNEIALGAMLF
jgi:hypothetical protein